MSLVTIGVMVAAGLAGLLGLAAASHAHDQGMYLFGLVLFLFAVLMNFLLLKRHFDEAEKAARE
jgi:ABC-type uncharacterized transport system permease subunit